MKQPINSFLSLSILITSLSGCIEHPTCEIAIESAPAGMEAYAQEALTKKGFKVVPSSEAELILSFAPESFVLKQNYYMAEHYYSHSVFTPRCRVKAELSDPSMNKTYAKRTATFGAENEKTAQEIWDAGEAFAKAGEFCNYRNAQVRKAFDQAITAVPECMIKGQ